MEGRSHLGIGIALGVAIGAGLGAALDNIALGISFGIAIGVALGLAMDEGGKRRKGRGDDTPRAPTRSEPPPDGALRAPPRGGRSGTRSPPAAPAPPDRDRLRARC